MEVSELPSSSSASDSQGHRVSTARFTLRCDGASRGNPGPAAVGVVIEDSEGRVIHGEGRCIGVTTNNVAEYQALITGLEWLGGVGAEHIEILLDSLLVAKQVVGAYKVKSQGLRPLHKRATELLAGFASVKVKHVPREQNSAADAFANEALDNGSAVQLESGPAENHLQGSESQRSLF